MPEGASLWTSAANEASGVLTHESLLKAMKAVRDMPPSPCSKGEHVVSPKAIYRPGWYRCGNCGSPVHIRMPLSEARSSDK